MECLHVAVPLRSDELVRRSDMDFRTEISVEELLAEPIVLALMKQDGVSIGEARALYVSVGQRL